MNFKRPSFKRGGPTGIAQLTPRKNFQFGTPGFEFLEPGLQNELRDSYRPPQVNTGKGLTKGSRGARLLSQLRKLSVPSLSTTGIMAAPFVLPTGIAYMNKPETLAEKKVMQDYGPIDETFFQYDEYDADRKAASKVGDKISFTDALFMDPETGKYSKAFGRTKDREEIEELFGTDDGFLPTPRFDSDQGVNMKEIVDTMVSDKKTKTKTKTDDKPELTFEDTYEAEKKKIEKLIGADDNKGIVAIALSDAIGTPGTIPEKAAVLNKALLGIMVGKKKDKKEIAMLAYKATKQIETAKIAANKQTDSAKNFEELKTLNRIIQDKTGTYNEDQKRAAQGQLSIISESIRVLNPQKETGLSSVDSKAIQGLDALATKLARLDKDSAGYKKAYDQYLRARIVVLKNKNLADLVALADAQVGLEFRKDGGRIGFANGSPIEQITETVETSGTPTAQVTQLSFEELRDRLPPEVTDDVIRFLSQSEQALQDFAYIRTAGDIKKFNMKYGLNLVLPAQA